MLNKGAFAFKIVGEALKWPLKGGSRLIEVATTAGLTVCFGCSKEPSHSDGSFEYPQNMFWLRKRKLLFWYALLTKGLIGMHLVISELCYKGTRLQRNYRKIPG